jgi:hypothetical protein
MKTLMAAILLATSLAAQAEITEKTVRMICGSKEDFLGTTTKYKEVPILGAVNPDVQAIYSLWANLATGTTSWAVQYPKTGEWCMIGVGMDIIIPDGSPLTDAPIGTRTSYQ